MLFSSLNCYNFAFHIPANVIYLNLRHCLFIFPTFALFVILSLNICHIQQFSLVFIIWNLVKRSNVVAIKMCLFEQLSVFLFIFGLLMPANKSRAVIKLTKRNDPEFGGAVKHESKWGGG